MGCKYGDGGTMREGGREREGESGIMGEGDRERGRERVG